MPALEYSKQVEDQIVQKRLTANTKFLLKMKFKKMAAKMIENGYFPYQYKIVDKDELEDNKNHILIAVFKQEEWLFND